MVRQIKQRYDWQSERNLPKQKNSYEIVEGIMFCLSMILFAIIYNLVAICL